MTIRISALIPGKGDTTNFYRGSGPFGALRHKLDGFTFTKVKDVSWEILKFTDVLFMQRPHTVDHLMALRYAKQNGVKVWVDFDDHLGAVPQGSPSYDDYAGCGEIVKSISDEADAVTVSTPELHRVLGGKPHLHVIPNAIDDYVFPDWKETPFEREKIILWRGSKTHERDLRNVLDQLSIVASSDVAKDWTWWFLGYNPWFLTEKMNEGQFNFIASSDLIGYYSLIKNLRPAVMIVPLEDDSFNRCKSNLAFLDATYAGAVCLSTNLLEFTSSAGCVTVSNERFSDGLSWLLGQFNRDVGFGVESNEVARSYVEKNQVLSLVNEKRLEVLKGLVKWG